MPLLDTSLVPIVSVIVPAFNCDAYLDAALASLSAQTINDIEIIVVDDGSIDQTANVAAAYAKVDPRVHLIRRESASGRPSCARNDGIKMARGRYLAMHDADDISLPTRLATCISAMERTGAHFAFADYRHTYDDTGEMSINTVLENTDFLSRAAEYLTAISDDVFLCSPQFPAFLLTSTAVNTPTVVFDRELLKAERIWFDESLVYSEDVDLWFRLAQKTPFVFVNQVHSFNRRHSASLTASNPTSTQIGAIAVRRNQLAKLRPTLSQRELAAANRAMARLLRDLAYSSWCKGDRHGARSAFRESWRFKPTFSAALGYLKAFIARDAAIAGARRLGIVPGA